MRKVLLYIAMSLDGYLAAEDGSVDWLVGENPQEPNMGSYPKFIQSVDTVIMGYRTYHQIVTELMPGRWPYAGKTVYVLTHRVCSPVTGVHFVNMEMEALLNEIRCQDGKDIWICGGADIIAQCVKKNIINRFCITVIPYVLGKGIRLFPELDQSVSLKFISTEVYNGMVDLVYEPRNQK